MTYTRKERDRNFLQFTAFADKAYDATYNRQHRGEIKQAITSFGRTYFQDSEAEHCRKMISLTTLVQRYCLNERIATTAKKIEEGCQLLINGKKQRSPAQIKAAKAYVSAETKANNFFKNYATLMSLKSGSLINKVI